MAEMYTVDEARALLEDLRPMLDEIVVVRADAAELASAVRSGTPSPLGGLPEVKALEARLDELVSAVAATGVQVKGFAPLLLDWPSYLDGVAVLLCWLEGEAELAWYHRLELGFLGRRRLAR